MSGIQSPEKIQRNTFDQEILASPESLERIFNLKENSLDQSKLDSLNNMYWGDQGKLETDSVGQKELNQLKISPRTILTVALRKITNEANANSARQAIENKKVEAGAKAKNILQKSVGWVAGLPKAVEASYMNLAHMASNGINQAANAVVGVAGEDSFVGKIAKTVDDHAGLNNTEAAVDLTEEIFNNTKAFKTKEHIETKLLKKIQDIILAGEKNGYLSGVAAKLAAFLAVYFNKSTSDVLHAIKNQPNETLNYAISQIAEQILQARLEQAKIEGAGDALEQSVLSRSVLIRDRIKGRIAGPTEGVNIQKLAIQFGTGSIGTAVDIVTQAYGGQLGENNRMQIIKKQVEATPEFQEVAATLAESLNEEKISKEEYAQIYERILSKQSHQKYLEVVDLELKNNEKIAEVMTGKGIVGFLKKTAAEFTALGKVASLTGGIIDEGGLSENIGQNDRMMEEFADFISSEEASEGAKQLYKDMESFKVISLPKTEALALMTRKIMTEIPDNGLVIAGKVAQVIVKQLRDQAVSFMTMRPVVVASAVGLAAVSGGAMAFGGQTGKFTESSLETGFTRNLSIDKEGLSAKENFENAAIMYANRANPLSVIKGSVDTIVNFGDHVSGGAVSRTINSGLQSADNLSGNNISKGYNAAMEGIKGAPGRIADLAVRAGGSYLDYLKSVQKSVVHTFTSGEAGIAAETQPTKNSSADGRMAQASLNVAKGGFVDFSGKKAGEVIDYKFISNGKEVDLKPTYLGSTDGTSALRIDVENLRSKGYTIAEAKSSAGGSFPIIKDSEGKIVENIRTGWLLDSKGNPTNIPIIIEGKGRDGDINAKQISEEFASMKPVDFAAAKNSGVLQINDKTASAKPEAKSSSQTQPQTAPNSAKPAINFGSLQNTFGINSTADALLNKGASIDANLQNSGVNPGQFNQTLAGGFSILNDLKQRIPTAANEVMATVQGAFVPQEKPAASYNSAQRTLNVIANTALGVDIVTDQNISGVKGMMGARDFYNNLFKLRDTSVVGHDKLRSLANNPNQALSEADAKLIVGGKPLSEHKELFNKYPKLAESVARANTDTQIESFNLETHDKRGFDFLQTAIGLFTGKIAIAIKTDKGFSGEMTASTTLNVDTSTVFNPKNFSLKVDNLDKPGTVEVNSEKGLPIKLVVTENGVSSATITVRNNGKESVITVTNKLLLEELASGRLTGEAAIKAIEGDPTSRVKYSTGNIEKIGPNTLNSILAGSETVNKEWLKGTLKIDSRNIDAKQPIVITGANGEKIDVLKTLAKASGFTAQLSGVSQQVSSNNGLYINGEGITRFTDKTAVGRGGGNDLGSFLQLASIKPDLATEIAAKIRDYASNPSAFLNRPDLSGEEKAYIVNVYQAGSKLSPEFAQQLRTGAFTEQGLNSAAKLIGNVDNSLIIKTAAEREIDADLEKYKGDIDQMVTNPFYPANATGLERKLILLDAVRKDITDKGQYVSEAKVYDTNLLSLTKNLNAVMGTGKESITSSGNDTVASVSYRAENITEQQANTWREVIIPMVQEQIKQTGTLYGMNIGGGDGAKLAQVLGAIGNFLSPNIFGITGSTTREGSSGHVDLSNANPKVDNAGAALSVLSNPKQLENVAEYMKNGKNTSGFGFTAYEAFSQISKEITATEKKVEVNGKMQYVYQVEGGKPIVTSERVSAAEMAKMLHVIATSKEGAELIGTVTQWTAYNFADVVLKIKDTNPINVIPVSEFRSRIAAGLNGEAATKINSQLSIMEKQLAKSEIKVGEAEFKAIQANSIHITSLDDLKKLGVSGDQFMLAGKYQQDGVAIFNKNNSLGQGWYIKPADLEKFKNGEITPVYMKGCDGNIAYIAQPVVAVNVSTAIDAEINNQSSSQKVKLTGAAGVFKREETHTSATFKPEKPKPPEPKKEPEPVLTNNRKVETPAPAAAPAPGVVKPGPQQGTNLDPNANPPSIAPPGVKAPMVQESVPFSVAKPIPTPAVNAPQTIQVAPTPQISPTPPIPTPSAVPAAIIAPPQPTIGVPNIPVAPVPTALPPLPVDPVITNVIPKEIPVPIPASDIGSNVTNNVINNGDLTGGVSIIRDIPNAPVF